MNVAAFLTEPRVENPLDLLSRGLSRFGFPEFSLTEWSSLVWQARISDPERLTPLLQRVFEAGEKFSAQWWPNARITPADKRRLLPDLLIVSLGLRFMMPFARNYMLDAVAPPSEPAQAPASVATDICSGTEIPELDRTSPPFKAVERLLSRFTSDSEPEASLRRLSASVADNGRSPRPLPRVINRQSAAATYDLALVFLIFLRLWPFPRRVPIQLAVYHFLCELGAKLPPDGCGVSSQTGGSFRVHLRSVERRLRLFAANPKRFTLRQRRELYFRYPASLFWMVAFDRLMPSDELRASLNSLFPLPPDSAKAKSPKK
jgi:hypothetical protein